NGRRETGSPARSRQGIRPRNILPRSGFSWRHSGPAFECVRESAGVLVAEQPCDLGNRHIVFPQVAFSEVASQLAQDAAKGKPLYPEPALKRTGTHSKLAGNLDYSRFPVRQER